MLTQRSDEKRLLDMATLQSLLWSSALAERAGRSSRLDGNVHTLKGHRSCFINFLCLDFQFDCEVE